jgi:hypothetical protein
LVEEADVTGDFSQCVRATLAAAAFALLLAGAPARAEQCGDPTGDEETTAADALETLHVALGLIECEPCVCDVDGSGDVAAVDALAILAFAVGESADFACPPCATTTTTLPRRMECGDPRVGAPTCDGYCGVDGQMCVESPPGSGNCQCIVGPGCGSVAGAPVCAGSCPALWICVDIGGTCRCELLAQ